jgi:hypothetical protein
MVPFQPIIEDGQAAFAMLEDLQRKHDWVFKTLRYSSLERLIETMDKEIVEPAEAKFRQLLVRRAAPSRTGERCASVGVLEPGPPSARRW